MKGVNKKIQRKTKWIAALVGICSILAVVVSAVCFFQIDETRAREVADQNVPSDAEYFGVDVYDNSVIRRYDYTYVVGSDYFKFSVDGFGRVFDERKEATSDPTGEKALALVTTTEDEEAMKKAAVSKEKAESIALNNSRPGSEVLGNGYRASSGYQYYDFVIKSNDGIYRVMVDSNSGEVLWNAKLT